jgi:hypothetical protein
MATIMTALTTQLFERGRADPEYFLPSHTQIEQNLRQVKTVPLGRLGRVSCSAFYPAATRLYSETGVPFLRCVDVVDFPVLSPDQPFVRIPQAFADAHRSIRHLSAGDVVVSKVGTPCFASLLSDSMPQTAMTRTVLGITHVQSQLVDPYYLVAFLRSRHGFDQLMRERELTIQYQLTLDRTKKIRVFLPDTPVQKEIGELIRKYYTKLRKSIDGYAASIAHFEKSSGIAAASLAAKSAERTSKVGLSQAFDAGRIDAQCFSPQALVYEQWLKGVASDRIGQLLAYAVKGTRHQESDSGSTDYCSIKHISNMEIVDASKCTPGSNEPSAKKDDLLLAVTGATIGKVGMVKRYPALAFSGDMLLMRANKRIDPHYLLLTLGHDVGQIQFRRWTTGSTNGHLAPHDVRRVLIPRLAAEEEAAIAKAVSDSLADRQESEKLLNQAISRIDDLIVSAKAP